jgi:DNA protecting protein dprA
MENIKYSNKVMFHFLSRIESIGVASLGKLYENIKPLSKILSMEKEEIVKFSGIDEAKAIDIIYCKKNYDKMYESYLSLKDKGISFISIEDEEFPEKLKSIPQAPFYLYVKGRLPDSNKPAVAIVGSRVCSSYGESMTKHIAAQLSKMNIDIISGMASGIDRRAHLAALGEGKNTYAVLAGGVDVCYPKQNIDIYAGILDMGFGIISELPPSAPSLKFNFCMRNRIISGLSDLVLVMEAKERSGTFITVGHALEQGKEVFALPGRLSDPLSKGCNKLIEGGASILLSADSIIESLGIIYDKKLSLIKKDINKLANKEKKVYSVIGLEATSVEEILAKTGMKTGDCMSVLLDLELKGYISQLFANYYVKNLIK